jgi:hypothetical protein
MSVIYTKELPDRPALRLPVTVRREGAEVIMEPSPVHGTKGFTLSMSRESAMALADELNGAAGDQ